MIVYTLSAAEILALQEVFTSAAERGSRVRLALDEDGLKVDDGSGWSLPMGTNTTARS